MPVLSALGGAAFTIAVCLAAGILLLRSLRLDFYRQEFPLFAFVGGSACVSLAIMLLCVVHQARLAVFLTGGVATIGWAVRAEMRAPRKRESLPALPVAWRIVFTVVFAAFCACYLCNAAAPEVSPDGSSYHLGNVARDLRHQGFDWNFHSIYSSMPQGMEMLFLLAFAIGRHSAAALVHAAFQAALPLLIVCSGRRLGFPRVGCFAALVTYASPVVGIDGVSAYNDLTIATLIYADFFLLQVKSQKINTNRNILIGLLAGFAFSVKYTAGILLPFAAIGSKGRKLGALLAGAAIIAGPWILRNWIWTGNPAAPFLNGWFPNRFWTTAAEHQYLAGLGQYPPFKSLWDFFLQLTVLGGFVPGMIGPVFILLPLALLALRHPYGRRVLAAAAVFALPAFFNTEVRFLIPAIPFLALALGFAMENSWGALPAIALFQSLVCWPAVMDTYCDRIAWRVRGLPIRAALRIDSEDAYIASRVGDYPLRDAIAKDVPAGARIFSFAGRAAAYLPRDIVVGYESSDGIRVQEALQNAAAAHRGQREAVLSAKAAGLTHLLIEDADGVAPDIKNSLSTWGLSEVTKANETTLYRID